MKFTVEGKKTEYISVEINAKDRREAARLFAERNKGFSPESVCSRNDGWNVVGQCEVSSDYIFDDDDYVTNEDGIEFLRENLPDDEEE